MSDFFRCVFYVIYNGVKRLRRSIILPAMLFFSVLFWLLFVWNIRGAAADLGYGVTPYMLPHFFSNGVFETYGLLLLVLVSCDAPFLDEDRIYTIKRCGKTSWAIGKMGYLLAANLCFQVIFFLAQCLCLFPQIGISKGWGSVLYTCGSTPEVLAEYGGYGAVSSILMESYSPFEAMGRQILLCLLLGMIIGAVTFLINGLTGKMVGSVVLVGMVLAKQFLPMMDFYFYTGLADSFCFNWLNLTDYADGTYSFAENGLLLSAMFVLIGAVCVICVKRNYIKTTE